MALQSSCCHYGGSFLLFSHVRELQDTPGRKLIAAKGCCVQVSGGALQIVV
ncbi:hypothetical protein [uncultured Phascolarctobacterium sp.]|uniref:hypothetical protein n=1 Tax=uncultured Phascolarctobacterium sp. TaxID=512296 RepID=UPI0025FE51C7|nr:hypothetical protein [uncultured Phascolarctobacterium sp.]